MQPFRCTLFCLVVIILPRTVFAEDVLYEEQFIFDPEVSSHGHVHASTVVECPNGDLRAVWFASLWSFIRLGGAAS